MTNRELAAILFNIATILREREDNPYRIRAYERGARALMGSRVDMGNALTHAGTPFRRRKGTLGDKLQRKLRELATDGRMAFFDELCAELPPHIGALMQVPGVGPKTARQLYAALGVETPAQLQAAARRGTLASVWGFGAKRTEQIAQLSLFDDPAGDPAQRQAA